MLTAEKGELCTNFLDSGYTLELVHLSSNLSDCGLFEELFIAVMQEGN